MSLTPPGTRRGRLGAVAGLVLALLVAGSVIARTMFDPYAIDTELLRAVRPSGEHLLGTDQLGRDVLVRVASGITHTLWFGVVVAVAWAATMLVAGGLVGLVERRVRVHEIVLLGIAVAASVVALGAVARGVVWAFDGTSLQLIVEDYGFRAWGVGTIGGVAALVVGALVLDAARRLAARTMPRRRVLRRLAGTALLMLVATLAIEIETELAFEPPTPSLGSIVQELVRFDAALELWWITVTVASAAGLLLGALVALAASVWPPRVASD